MLQWQVQRKTLSQSRTITEATYWNLECNIAHWQRIWTSGRSYQIPARHSRSLIQKAKGKRDTDIEQKVATFLHWCPPSISCTSRSRDIHKPRVC